jgi:hypothetical protein
MLPEVEIPWIHFLPAACWKWRDVKVIPSPHVCCRCKREVVWTDCLPAVCWKCEDAKMQERARKREESEVQPDATVISDPEERE